MIFATHGISRVRNLSTKLLKELISQPDFPEHVSFSPVTQLDHGREHTHNIIVPVSAREDRHTRAPQDLRADSSNRHQ